MIEGRAGDADFNRNRRIAHNGTFNANPLSAAAGIAALKIVANEPINDTANARAAQLKDGLNDVLGRLEIPGCATGITSLLFLRLGVDHECDRGVLRPATRPDGAVHGTRARPAANAVAYQPRRPVRKQVRPNRRPHRGRHRPTPSTPASSPSTKSERSA